MSPAIICGTRPCLFPYAKQTNPTPPTANEAKRTFASKSTLFFSVTPPPRRSFQAHASCATILRISPGDGSPAFVIAWQSAFGEP
jgi:hypothetical protein